MNAKRKVESLEFENLQLEMKLKEEEARFETGLKKEEAEGVEQKEVERGMQERVAKLKKKLEEAQRNVMI